MIDMDSDTDCKLLNEINVSSRLFSIIRLFNVVTVLFTACV